MEHDTTWPHMSSSALFAASDWPRYDSSSLDHVVTNLIKFVVHVTVDGLGICLLVASLTLVSVDSLAPNAHGNSLLITCLFVVFLFEERNE